MTRGVSRAETQATYPAFIRITDEMMMYVKGLLILFHADMPLTVLIRPTNARKVRYHIGDVSAEGFAAGTQYPDLVLESRDGLWKPDFAVRGSNLREGQNIANHLLMDIRAGKHDGCEVWSATDNAVWSAVCNKGMSTAKHLFN